MRRTARPVIFSIVGVLATTGLAACQPMGEHADPVTEKGFGPAVVAVAVSSPLENTPNVSSVVLVDDEGMSEVVSIGEIAMGAVSARPGELVAPTPEDGIRWTQRDTTIQSREDPQDMVDRSLSFADRDVTVFNVGTKDTDSYYYSVSVWEDDNTMRQVELEGIFMGLTECHSDLYALMQPYSDPTGPPALIRLAEDGETWKRQVIEPRLRLPGRIRTWDPSVTCLDGRIGTLMTTPSRRGAQTWMIWMDPTNGATSHVHVPDLRAGDLAVVGRWRDGLIVQDTRTRSFRHVSHEGEVRKVWEMPPEVLLASASVTGEGELLVWADTAAGHNITWIDPTTGSLRRTIDAIGLDDRLGRLGQYLSGNPADLAAGDSTSRPDFN